MVLVFLPLFLHSSLFLDSPYGHLSFNEVNTRTFLNHHNESGSSSFLLLQLRRAVTMSFLIRCPKAIYGHQYPCPDFDFFPRGLTWNPGNLVSSPYGWAWKPLLPLRPRFRSLKPGLKPLRPDLKPLRPCLRPGRPLRL